MIPQDVPGRIFPDTIRTRELFRVPKEPDSLAGHFFYTPEAVRADQHDHLFVVDFGVIKIHRFDENGDYAASYGLGIGEGPGELVSVLDMGVVGDAVVDVVDNSARKVQFFAMDGSYLRSESTSFFPVTYNVTGGGRVYAMTAQFEYLFKSRMGDDIVAFKSVPQDPNGMPGDGMLLGHLAVYKESLVYPPINFPVIVQYTPSRAVAYARSTPD